MSDYKYAKGDLLSSPNTYFYTAYQGREFIESWKSSRSATVKGIEPLQVLVESGHIIPLSDVLKRSVIETVVLLDSLYADICKHESGISSEAGLLVNTFLKKFEVSKRVYRFYDGDFKAVNKQAYSDLPLYLRLAEIFEKAYVRLGNIQYLNVLLKIVDTLCSFSDLLREAEKSRLALLIEQEFKHIKELAEQAGVKI